MEVQIAIGIGGAARMSCGSEVIASFSFKFTLHILITVNFADLRLLPTVFLQADQNSCHLHTKRQ